MTGRVTPPDATYVAAAGDASARDGAPMRGRVCVVTGAARGIGRATAVGLARLGATVIVVVRDAARAGAVVAEMRRESASDAITAVVADLASQAAVRRAAAEIERRAAALHVLVHNAGVSLARRTVTEDGIEATLAVNHLAPFLLTKLLLPLLRASAPARGVTVTSEFERMGRIDFDDLQTARRYIGTRAYTQSKLANILFTHALAERLAGTGVTANCVEPGLVATDLLRDRWWWGPRWLQPVWRRVFRTPERAARGIVWLASSPDVERVSGQCFKDARPVRTSARSRDRALAERLWEVSARLTGE